LAFGDLRVGLRNFLRSLPLTGSALIVQLQTSGLILLVSFLFGASAIASFATLRTLANTMVQAAMLLFAPAIPELVRLHVRDQPEKLRAGLFGLATFATFPTALGTLLVAGGAELFYEIWTRHKIPFDRGMFQTLAAAVLWRIFGAPLANHMLAMNNTRWVAMTALAQTGTLLGVTFVLSPVLGVHGVGAGLLAGELVGSFLIPALWLAQTLEPAVRPAFVDQQIVAALMPALSTVALLASIRAAPATRNLMLASAALLSTGLFLRQLRSIPAEVRQQLSTTIARFVRRRP
jgi:O-antigen/teichoic acid export membrane protein